MGNVTTIGLDVTKSVFQVDGTPGEQFVPDANSHNDGANVRFSLLRASQNLPSRARLRLCTPTVGQP